jgi:hypothetical protein
VKHDGADVADSREQILRTGRPATPIIARNQQLKGSTAKVNPASPRNHGKRDILETYPNIQAMTRSAQWIGNYLHVLSFRVF